MTLSRLLISSLISLCLCCSVQAYENLENFDEKTLSTYNDIVNDIDRRLRDNAEKEVDGLIIENRTTDPSSPAVGQVWFRTDL